jgi:alanine-synthesizing transaminase
MFSSRTAGAEVARNRLARALDRARDDGRTIIDLTLSNPTRAGIEYPADLLEPLGHTRGLAYAPEPFGLYPARCAVAGDYRRRGLAVPPERIVMTASTSEAYSLLFKLLCDAGDEVLVPRPSYPLFEHLARLDAVAVRPYDLDYHGMWSVDVESVRNAMTPRTRALLLVSPNNPTGSLVTPRELDALAALSGADGPALIADEVFADYELTSGALARAGHVIGRRDVLAFALGGMSKSIGLPQVKLAWCAVAGPDALVEQALTRLELACDTYLSVSTPIQMAVPGLLDAGTIVRERIQSRVRSNYELLKTSAARVPSCSVLHADAGWYAILQVPSLESEEDLVCELLTRHSVLVHPGYFFDFVRESYLVVSLLPPPALFGEGVTRILRHFDCKAGQA